MSDFEEHLAELARLRHERRRADARLQDARRRSAAIAREGETLRRRGTASADLVARLDVELRQVHEQLSRANADLAARDRELAASLDGLATLGDPTRLIERWDDRIPILLLPVRLETRFMPVAGPSELWVRMFPDDVAVHTREAEATADGRNTPVDEIWNRAPCARVMPDRFVVVLTAAGRPDRTVIGAQIPDPLVLGPDPSAQDLGIDRVDSEIQLADQLRWMHDFAEAERIGLAVKVPLNTEEASAGFDQLFVIGLRLSADPQQSRALIEELIDNHRRAPDGAALIPQGTPTNNTTEVPSGFHSGSASTTAAADPLFGPVDEPSKRVDGQWLAEALGIDYEALTRLERADNTDVREARLMNQALWPATLGYYLEQMLGVDAGRVREIERFFVEYVSGRGPLPAVRVGAQPYGLLLTSDTRRWHDGGAVSSVSAQVRSLLARLEPFWDSSLASAAFVGKPGDSHALLLDMLGLHATSVDYFRRHAIGSGYLWNFAQFKGWGGAAGDARNALIAAARRLLTELGWPVNDPPPIMDLSFFSTHSHITDPLIADVPAVADEILSETVGVRRLYHIEAVDQLQNYLGWLHGSSVPDIKTQRFLDAQGEELPVPRALLYRLLRHALLLAHVDAALRLYEANGVVTAMARREVELPNVRAERTVTRWELIEARVDRVLPQLNDRPRAVFEYLGSEAGQAQPSVEGLTRVRAALAELGDLPTARLERLLAEHLDLCSYRLDAWQTGLFTERLRALRDPRQTGRSADRALGVYLGAFGWLEEVRPGAPALTVAPEEIPQSLREPERGAVVEQADSGGAIHGVSTTHAVAAAVLRNAYLTHASPSARELMSVDLSSERARVASFFLEGIANGQPLGALLGYQFQRGLKERHGDPSLAQFVQNFRDAYPLRADKITPDTGNDAAALKEASNVFDGYALLERTLLAQPPIGYPYGVAGLPAATSTQGSAIRREVERMAWTMDAVADVALAEGVYQIAQGNYDRGGAMLQAVTRGTHPPEPEILRTPRSGAAITHRVALHLDVAAETRVWSSSSTPRSRAVPALNAWFADRLGAPSRLRYVVRHGPDNIEDATTSVADLGIEPIDLVHFIGDELGDGESELVRRIRHAYRLAHGGADAPDVQTITVEFPARHSAWGSNDVSLFEAMPLISALKRLATTARPLGAADYMLPSEDTTDPAVDPNPQRFDEPATGARVDATLAELSTARQHLSSAIDAASALDLAAADANERAAALSALWDRTRVVAAFGFPDAFVDVRAIPPHAGEAPTPFERAWAQQLDLSASVNRQALARLAEGTRLRNLADLSPAEVTALTVTQKIERYREAARQLLGADFNLLPRFTFKNGEELAAAASFGELPPAAGLLRHSADPMVVETWFQGAACVRERLGLLETIATMGDAFGAAYFSLRPLQLPFRTADHWVAVEYPEEFKPAGDFLSIVQHAASGFDPAATQTGLLVDAWTEVIPNRVETTGVAIHYNQPGAQPPQTLLLAVAPELTGTWTWIELLGVVTDTLRRSKLRAVEPDHLQASALAHLLPAVLTPTASRVGATVSADLLHQTAVAFARE